jgi:hypothetical protein
MAQGSRPPCTAGPGWKPSPSNLFAPDWSLLVLLAWPAAALAVAAVLITRRDA